MVLVAQPKKQPPAHYRKRVGQHHKQGKHYTKTYWPYLPLLGVAAFGLLFSSMWSAWQQHAVLGTSADVFSQQLLAATNQARQSDHELTLHSNAALDSAAQAKADDMAARNYWSHTTPDGKQPWWFITQAGYHYTAAGENLAYGFGSGDAAVAAWMHSDEHRANMLNGNFQDVGFGVARSADFQDAGPETIIVAMYGEPAGATATASGHQAVLAAATARPVTRLQTFASTSPWTAGALAALAGFCLITLFVKHRQAWQRAVATGERLLVKNHLLDIILVLVGVAGFLLTRSAGAIH